jgi:hypothetical protein
MIRFTETNRHDFFVPTDPHLVLPHRLAVAIQATEYPFAFELLQPHDRSAGRRLYAAALRDILGIRRRDVAAACGLSLRETDDAISRAREDWSQLRGWPWWYFDDRGGKPPDDWHQRGGSAPVNAALITWATGRLHPPSHFKREALSRP